MCDIVLSEDPFMLVCGTGKYKTQRVYDEAFDDCLTAIKFVLYWFVTSKK